MSRPMNDQEVRDELKKMQAFIKQEAMEKAREIKVKADEEFTVEKGKIVRQETIKIDQQFETKRKQAEIQKRIAQSNRTNQSRLKLLEKRENLLEEVFEAAREKVASLAADDSKYQSLLKDLVLQALFTIMEADIKVVCRKKDADKVKSAADDAKQAFEDAAGFEIKLEIVEELSDESNGGVTLVGYNSRITVDNSLDERLRILEMNALPLLRTDLFGPNSSRKFYT